MPANSTSAMGPLTLIDFLGAIRRQWWLIAAGTIVSAAAAIILLLLLPPAYEASATLLLQPPPFQEKTREDQGFDVAGMLPDALTIQDVRVLLTSDGTLTKVKNRLRETPSWKSIDLDREAGLAALSRSLEFESTLLEKTAQGTAYSRVILLKARARTPELARDLAQAWAEVSVEVSGDFYRTSSSGMSDFLSSQEIEIRQQLEEVYGQQRDIETNWVSEVALKKMLDLADLLKITHDLYAERLVLGRGAAEEAAVAGSLAGETDPTITLKKWPPGRSMLGAESDPPSATPPNAFEEEVISPAYEDLTIVAARQAANAAALEEERVALAERIEQLDGDLARLQAANAQYHYESKRLETQAIVLEMNYEAIVGNLQQARLAESEQDNLADLSIAAEAVAPDEPAPRYRKRITTVAAAFGFCIALFAALLRDHSAQHPT